VHPNRRFGVADRAAIARPVIASQSHGSVTGREVVMSGGWGKDAARRTSQNPDKVVP
jgi:hypothetical protein